MTTPLSLTAADCRVRQQRLRAVLERLDLARAVLVLPEHVQWLTGFRPHRLMQACATLEADGTCRLIAPNEIPADAAADDIRPFAAQWHCTLRQDQLQAASVVLREALADSQGTGRCGVEFSVFGPHLAAATGIESHALLADIEPELWQLRRHKEPDELRLIERAIACTEAMYARAREIIAPGVTELTVFNELQSAAVQVAGEPLTGTGNDYRCNAPGGSPRNRPIEAGELYILDLGPAYRGYFADNCRAFSVDRRPTDIQLEAWQTIVETLALVEQMVRPGVSCREVFQAAQEKLDGWRVGSFAHHLGHGIGLYPHEAPHLNPHWDDTFAEGDVFTAEPGLYAPELQAGIRLEQDYRVTADGVQRLTQFPLEL